MNEKERKLVRTQINGMKEEENENDYALEWTLNSVGGHRRNSRYKSDLYIYMHRRSNFNSRRKAEENKNKKNKEEWKSRSDEKKTHHEKKI